MCGWCAWGVGGSLGVCGVCIGHGCKERMSLAPLYNPDSLENPDTCLGILFLFTS